ncbi:CocE/NonD family hydrolase [Kutzneria sp. CA-103260]|uniref:CocE/NonD family hydrolase n=1 Tax=Kutzneria sp. CA-103260 TaxID=2802641 RepID=UPI001BACAE5C|nr:CocE/NonD family hydrolase [Kutzneria sp. CA-103260]QUQ68855.1 X-Pro dipeptidyl-peptidase [Kutzneria sp. CA-103260]
MTVGIVVEHGLRVPMRDGACLLTDVWRPATDEPLPALLFRTPYGDQVVRAASPERLATEGFAVVAQHCRGRFGSEGEWIYVHSDVEDGFDAVEWAAAQPWCNGRVGMFGASYSGNTQWLAAQARPPHLVAIAPEACAADYWEGMFDSGGAFRLALRLGWTVFVVAAMAAEWGIQDDELANLRELSAESYDAAQSDDPNRLDRIRRRLRAAVEKVLRRRPIRDNPLWHGRATWLDELFEHESRTDSHWLRVNPTTHYGAIDLPALHIGSWYDIHLGATLRHYTGMRRQAPTERARQGQRLLIGPWDHWHPGNSTVGDIAFGTDAAIDLAQVRANWFREQLCDEPAANRPPVRIFVMGSNVWRDEREWPLARTEYTRWYLRSDGRLLPEPPADDHDVDRFTFDPADPVPTLGGRLLGAGGEQPGPLDQRAVGERDDLLDYLSPVLTEDVELTGPVTMDLWAGTDAPDTDFTALLLDVRPDGRWVNLCEGAVRARHSGVTMPLVPGAVYHFTIDLAATSAVLFAGHRVGLRLSSSSFPEWEPNPNTGNPLGVDTGPDVRVAHQAIHRGRLHPSSIVLPVIPAQPR